MRIHAPFPGASPARIPRGPNGWCTGPMRIMIAAESFLPHLSGVTTSVLRTAEQLIQRGHEVAILAPETGPGEQTPQHPVPRAVCLRVPSLPVAGYPGLRVAPGPVAPVRRLIARHHPDIVHAASPFLLGARAVTAARDLGIPCAAVYQTDVSAYARRYRLPWLARAADRRLAAIHGQADLTLAPSRASEDYLRDLGVPRVLRWGRGVDTALFRPDRAERSLRAQIGAGPAELVVGYVGRLAPEKQVEDLRVLQSLPGVRLVVVGDGPERARLEHTLHRASFLGRLEGEELARTVAELDVFTHPGESETFGQTLQEAMAAGTPVVAVGCGGPADIVEHGRTGLLYPPGRLDRLREHVQRLGDPDLRARFAAAGREAMMPRSWSALTDRLLEHYALARQFHRADGLRRWAAGRVQSSAGSRASTPQAR